jgi:hypothetical protein
MFEETIQNLKKILQVTKEFREATDLAMEQVAKLFFSRNLDQQQKN